MVLEYKSIVPWGRSLKEYREMFNLSEEELNLKILGCGDGPASFNAELTRQGRSVTSCDPVYAFTSDQLRQRINETFDEVKEQTGQNAEKFIWNSIGSLEELGQIRMQAMNLFLDDYESGLKKGRYVDAELPDLPFDQDQFDLALCSHFLFLYSNHLTLDFHIQSIQEMLRVAKDVRIFPLLDYNGNQSEYLGPVIDQLNERQFQVQVEVVPYEFQKGGNQMLHICK